MNGSRNLNETAGDSFVADRLTQDFRRPIAATTALQHRVLRGRMKRLLIFALLGPPLGLFVGLWVMLPILNWALGAPSVFDYHQLILFPIAYPVGLVPACLAGLFDGFLARRRARHGVLWTALFGFAISFLPLASSYAMGFIHGSFILLFGFVGAVPAAVCAWIARMLVRPAAAT